jgi:hypothetical protein
MPSVFSTAEYVQFHGAVHFNVANRSGQRVHLAISLVGQDTKASSISDKWLLISVQNRRGDEDREEMKKKERESKKETTEDSITTLKTPVSFLCSCWQLVPQSVCLCSYRSCWVMFCMFSGSRSYPVPHSGERVKQRTVQAHNWNKKSFLSVKTLFLLIIFLGRTDEYSGFVSYIRKIPYAYIHQCTYTKFLQGTKKIPKQKIMPMEVSLYTLFDIFVCLIS